MKLLNIKILSGPNYWSTYRKKLIVLKVDLEAYESLLSNLIPGFIHGLKNLLPSLNNHYCSEAHVGGFFKRLELGTWLSHVIEHVALELQWLAGMKCSYGRTRSSNNPGIYHIIFSYEYESAGLLAGKTAFNIVKTLAEGENYTSLFTDIYNLTTIHNEEKFGPSTQAIVNELQNYQIPYQRLDKQSLLLLGQGKNQKYILATETSFTSIIGVEIASDKELTKEILAANCIPVPQGIILNSEQEIEQALQMLKLPVVMKPLNANHGKGVTINIHNFETAYKAYLFAKEFSTKVICETQILGSDYRFLVVNYHVIAVARREPAKIVGNGKTTIRGLIYQVNNDPKRGKGHENFLSEIEIDETTLHILKQNNLTMESILADGEILYLKHAANLSSGGTAEDVTDIVHHENIFLAERVARLINLDVCGIDIVCNDINKPIIENYNGAVIEVNSAPGLRMHLAPSYGVSRNVAKAIVEMLYPKGTNARIPIIAVTGTNGKTTVIRLLSYIASKMGLSVGCTTTDGIYLLNHKIYSGDSSGPISAKIVLNDPAVEFAILECARGGILRSGLGFDYCDISILTNIKEDHLGMDDIESLAELTRTKAVVPKSTFKHGYTILNADDDLVFSIKFDVDCQVALFSMTKSPRIVQHLASGGIAAYLDQNQIHIESQNYKKNLGNILDFPITFSGKATCNLKNILPVVLAAFLSHFSTDVIIDSLKSFIPTPELLPGRMNLFMFKNKILMLDYAHNYDAFIELNNYISSIKASKKIAILAATGDRREQDIIQLGKHAAMAFDEIVIRHDKDGRGRTNQELTNLLLEGFKRSHKKISVSVISDEFEALSFTLNNASPHSFIFYFPDNVEKALDYIKEYKQTEHVMETVQ